MALWGTAAPCVQSRHETRRIPGDEFSSWLVWLYLSRRPRDALLRPRFLRHPSAANHSKCRERCHCPSCRISDCPHLHVFVPLLSRLIRIVQSFSTAFCPRQFAAGPVCRSGKVCGYVLGMGSISSAGWTLPARDFKNNASVVEISLFGLLDRGRHSCRRHQ